MKKTLTTITLSGLALSAIANTEKPIQPVANISATLPTSGAVPIAKVPDSKNIKVSESKSDSVGIIPLPLPENNKEVTKGNSEIINSDTLEKLKNSEKEFNETKKVEKLKELKDSNKTKEQPVKKVAPIKSLEIKDLKESKDVKTEVTLEKKKNINTVKKVEDLPVVKQETKAESTESKKVLPVVPVVPMAPSNTEVVNVKKEEIKEEDTKPLLDVNKIKKEENKEIKKKQNVKKHTKKPTVQKTQKVKQNNISVVIPKTVIATGAATAAPQIISIDREKDHSLLKEEDVSVNVYYSKVSGEYLVKFENRFNQDFKNSDFYDLNQNNNIEPIIITWTNSDLSRMELLPQEVSDNGEYLLDIPASKGSCEALYVTYRLNSSKTAKTKAIILDREGNPTEAMSRSCKTPKISFNDNISHTKNGYVVSTHIGLNQSVKKPIEFSSIINKEGVDLNPSDLRYLIVNEDFSNLYYSVGANKTKHNSLGARFIQPINTTGVHFFNGVFRDENGNLEIGTSKINIIE